MTSNGTNGDDTITAATNAAGLTTVAGLPAQVRITGPDAGGLDGLTLNGLGGDDVIDASGLEAGRFRVTMNGGLGDDVFVGSGGDDLINGGDGDDTAFMGGRQRHLRLEPGRRQRHARGPGRLRHDALQRRERRGEHRHLGQRRARDVLPRRRERADGPERRRGDRLQRPRRRRQHRRQRPERNRRRRGEPDLAASPGVGDGAADTVTALATNGDDVVLVAGDATGVSVQGLAAQINIIGSEAANDRLVVNLLAGDDVLDGSALAAGAIQLTVDGGDGDDVIIGTAGNDVLLGGAGDDVLIGNGGVDVIDGGAGDNVILFASGVRFDVANFKSGDDARNRIDLSALGEDVDFRWVMENARQVGNDSVLELGEEDVRLLDTDVASLNEQDFIWG